jgi:hypothetical protein
MQPNPKWMSVFKRRNEGRRAYSSFGTSRQEPSSELERVEVRERSQQDAK